MTYQNIPDHQLTLAEALLSLPVLANELPRALVGPCIAGGDIPLADISPQIPTALPSLAPTRLLFGKFAKVVLSQQEYVFYVETWQRWVKDHPDFAEIGRRDDLQQIVMCDILLFRILEVMKYCGNTRQLQRAYNATWRRKVKARVRLGATRRQRLGTD